MADTVEMEILNHPIGTSLDFTSGFQQQSKDTFAVGPLDFAAHNFSIVNLKSAGDSLEEISGCQFTLSSDAAATAAAVEHKVTKADYTWIDIHVPGNRKKSAAINQGEFLFAFQSAPKVGQTEGYKTRFIIKGKTTLGDEVQPAPLAGGAQVALGGTGAVG
jgi:hypothetical protein